MPIKRQAWPSMYRDEQKLADPVT